MNINWFNWTVNQSHDPDEKYFRWTFYRRQITAFIQKCLADLEQTDRVKVFGAGSVNDLDLKFLCSRFNEVVLSDIDTRSILAGIRCQRLPADLASRIRIEQQDYTGAGQAGLFFGFGKRVRQKLTPDSLIEYLTQQLMATPPGFGSQSRAFDLVISCPVYTQLIYTQIEVILRKLQKKSGYSESDLNKILWAASNAMKPMLDRYNRLLLSALKPGGHILVLADLMAVQASDPDLKNAKASLHAAGRFEELIRIKKDACGLDMAWSGLELLEQKIKIIRTTHAIWPFDEKREFIVKGVFGHK